MTGTMGGAGGGNPFNSAPNAAPNPMGDFWGNSGDPSNPAVTAAQPTASAQTQAAAAPPPPPPPQPSQSDPSSIFHDLNNILFGGGQHATEPVKYQASAGQGMADISAPLTAPAPAPAATGAAAAALPPPNAPTGGLATEANAAPISPQSAPVSGNTGDISTPNAGATGATGAATPSIPKKIGGAATTFAQSLRSGAGSPETSPAPDIAGSAREAGAGPGGAGAVQNPAFSTPEGGGPPQVLQDLLSGNFGRFIADLLGQQGLPQGQNLAGAPAPGRGIGTIPPEAPPSPRGYAPPGQPTSTPSAAGGFGGGQSEMPPPPTRTASAAGAIGDPMGYQGGTGGQPGSIDPRYGTAAAARPPAAAPGVTPSGAPTAPGAQPSPQPIGGITQFGGVPALTANDVQFGGVHRANMQPTQPNVDRTRFSNEIAANRGSLPDGSAGSLMEQAAWMVRGEVLPGASITAQRVQLESAFNRAQDRGQTLANVLRPSLRRGDGGYYDGLRGLHRGTYRMDAKPTAAQLAQFKRDVWDPVVAGSNYSDVGFGPMTGNASGSVARNQFGKGTPGYRIRAGGDTYFREGVGRRPVGKFPTLPETAAAPSGVGASSIRSGDEENPPLPSGLPQTIDPRFGRAGVVHG